MFTCRNLYLIYDEKKSDPTYALKDINLELSGNKLIGIMGPSGSGKSSLLYALASLKDITSGSITYNGQPISSMGAGERALMRKEDFGFIFQRHFLIEYLTVLQNVLTPVNSVSKDLVNRAMELLEKLSIGHLVNKKPAELSVGQRQRVAIARALISKPKVIFGDEITASLDHTSAKEVMAVLNEYKKEHLVIIVTHDPTILVGAEEIVHIWDGTISKIEKKG